MENNNQTQVEDQDEDSSPKRVKLITPEILQQDVTVLMQSAEELNKNPEILNGPSMSLELIVAQLSVQKKLINSLVHKVNQLETELSNLKNNNQNPQTAKEDVLSQKGMQISYAKVVSSNLNPPAQQLSQESSSLTNYLTVPPKNKNNRGKNSTPVPPVEKPVQNQENPSPRSLFRQEVRKLSNLEDLKKKMFRPADAPPPSPRVEIAAVSSLYIQLDLTRKAQQDPLFAFRTTFEALTKVKPLGISLVSKSTAEIFISSEQVTKAERSLPLNVLIPKPQLGEKDVRRRAASYNRGYFKILRRQSLEGLANHIQMKVLDLAEESIPNLPPGRRLAVSKAIKEDRLWVAEEDEDSDLMNNPYYGGF
jgi:hypothetical protein